MKYPPHTDFYRDLKESVDSYFESTGRSRAGGMLLAAKAILLLLWLAASYVALVFFASNAWQATFCALSLSLAVAAIGFNVQHDGGHRSFSSSPWLNRMSAWTLDLIGGSSYLWNHQHNLLHHHYTNVDGVDHDLESGPFLRLAPTQKRRGLHRFQHLYAWALYGFVTVKWHLFDDFYYVLRGRMGSHPIPRPHGTQLVLFLLGKALFLTWAFVIPCLFHPVLLVLAVYAGCAFVNGVLLATVFQLAHCVEGTSFATPPPDDAKMESSWAEHQVQTTADFAPGQSLVTWFVGGLNYQVEHHLFPHISHVHYPAIAPIVKDVCARHGIRHNSQGTLGRALLSHFRFLKRMGRFDDLADGMAGAAVASGSSTAA